MNSSPNVMSLSPAPPPAPSFVDSAIAFADFVARLDLGKWPAPDPEAARAAVLVTPWSSTPLSWFALTTACLLRREGLNVTLVWQDRCNDRSGADDPATFAFESQVIETLMPAFRSFDIVRLGEQTPADLFARHRFDFAVIPSGLHGGTRALMAAGAACGVRMSSYDADPGRVQLGLHGPASWLPDLPRAVAEADSVLGLRRDSAREIARQHMGDRIGAGDGRGSADADVVIPLEGVWDAAAPGQHRFFRDHGEWLSQTVAFLLEQTQARVVVQGDAGPWEHELLARRDGRARLRFINPRTPANVHQLLAGARVVLPCTSPVGIEAAMLGRPVVLESHASYAELPFVEVASDRAGYFARIATHLQQPLVPDPTKVAAAELCYFFAAVSNAVETCFTPYAENFAVWSRMSFDALAAEEGVKTLVRSLCYDIPAALVQGRRLLDRQQGRPALVRPVALPPPPPMITPATAPAPVAPPLAAGASRPLPPLTVAPDQRQVSAIGLPFPCYPGVTFGTGVQIIGLRNVEIGEGSCVGDQAWLNICVRDDKVRMRIGRSVLIGRQSMVSTGGYLEIGDFGLFGPRVTVVDADHGFSDITRPYAEQTPTLDRSIIIEENVWIAVGAVVAGSLTVGRGSVIGANAVVTQDVPPFCVVVGHPGRIVKMYDPVTRLWEPARTEAEQRPIIENRARVPLPDRAQYLALLRQNARATRVIPIVAGRGECL